MCTIMTISRELFEANKSEIMLQIAQDAVGNPHGFGLILFGKKEEETLVTHAMHISPIIALLAEEGWTRMWLHCRFATSFTVNLHGCHPFSSVGTGRKFAGENDGIRGQYLVMHNGVLGSNDSKNFYVDSMLIPDLIRTRGLIPAKAYSLSESYANVFMVNPVTGEWTVTRTKSGTLHMDGHGNFSSSDIKGVIDIPVPDGWHKDYTHVFEKKIVTYPYQSRRLGNSVYDSFDDDDYWDRKYTSTNSTKSYRKDSLLDTDSNDPYNWERGKKKDKDTFETYADYYHNNFPQLREDLRAKQFDTFDTFFDLAVDLGWTDKKKVPSHFYKLLTSSQKKWLHQIKKGDWDSLEDLRKQASTEASTEQQQPKKTATN